MDITVQLTRDDITMLVDALEAYEYWELGDCLPRNNGEVWIPGDLPPEQDRYWGHSPPPTPRQAEMIERVRACRNLAGRLDVERRR